MAQSSPSTVVTNYDNAALTPVDFTQHVQTINDFDVENIMEETHTLGDLWEESKPIGVGRVPPIELSGLYDDVAATGPDALFAGRIPEGPAVATRTFQVVWKVSKTSTIETHLGLYRRSADRGGLSKYTARLQPTGALVEV